MTRRPPRDEILLEAPLARHADEVPAVEDRSYLVFIASALIVAIVGGFSLGVVTALAGAGVILEDRAPWLAQSHGWAQLQGWAGLFVAGMGLRLLPRFAGRKPLPREWNLVAWAPLFAAVVLRTVTQPGAGSFASEAGMLVASILWSIGAAYFAGLITYPLVRGREKREPWRAFAFAGAACWLAWAILALAAGIHGARNDAFVPIEVDEPLTWLAMLGAVANFIWAVQSRSVPIFFGRKTPSLRATAVPLGALNLGVVLFFVAAWVDAGEAHERLLGAGFVLSGLAIAWLAPLAGSCWGHPTRLRPRARFAARFVLAANWSIVVCGVLLIWAGVVTLGEGAATAYGVRDAARHAFGAGAITLLIVGMAQLVAPFFALRRVEAGRTPLADHAVLWLLGIGAALRVMSGLISEDAHEAAMHLAAAAGTLAWMGLVLFALSVFQAVRAEPRRKADLAQSAAQAAARNRATRT